MTLLPKVKFKTLPTFPATINGGAGIDVEKQNGALTVDLDYSDFGTISSIPTSPTSYILTYDTASLAYVMVPSHLLGGGVAGIADAPNDGTQYGRQSGAWTPNTAGNFIQAAAGAINRTMLAKAREVFSVTDFAGVDPTGVTDSSAGFVAAATASASGEIYVPRGTYYFNTVPTVPGHPVWTVQGGTTFTGGGIPRGSNVTFGPIPQSWINAYENFSYLEQFTGLNVRGPLNGIGLFAAAQSANGNGTPGYIDIGVASFAINNFPGGTSDVWGFYATVRREANTNGATHAMEIDVTNMGATVPLYPNAPFSEGQTHGLWVCTGGETALTHAVGTASAAMVILRNDPSATPTAKWDKGIIFAADALAGSTGASGEGVAIAFATFHEMRWYNNSNTVTGLISCTTQNNALGQRLDMTDAGFEVNDLAGRPWFRVEPNFGAINFVATLPGLTGVAPALIARGNDPNVDLKLSPKGSGVVQFGNSSTAASSPTSFSASRVIAIKDGTGGYLFIPASITGW